MPRTAPTCPRSSSATRRREWRCSSSTGTWTRRNGSLHGCVVLGRRSRPPGNRPGPRRHPTRRITKVFDTEDATGCPYPGEMHRPALGRPPLSAGAATAKVTRASPCAHGGHLSRRPKWAGIRQRLGDSLPDARYRARPGIEGTISPGLRLPKISSAHVRRHKGQPNTIEIRFFPSGGCRMGPGRRHRCPAGVDHRRGVVQREDVRGRETCRRYWAATGVAATPGRRRREGSRPKTPSGSQAFSMANGSAR